MRYIINEDDDLVTWEEQQDLNDIESIKKNKEYLDEILPIALKFLKRKYDGVLENVEVETFDYYYKALDFNIKSYEISFEFNDVLEDEDQYFLEIIEILQDIFGIEYNLYTMPLNVYVTQSN